MSINESSEQPIVELPGDERDVLISRIIDGVATSTDWSTFRAVAANDQSIWALLADTQLVHEKICDHVQSEIVIADHIGIPIGVIDDQPLKNRFDLISQWGGWVVAAAVVLIWNFGSSTAVLSNNDFPKNIAGLPGSGLLLNQAQPDQAFDQYLSSGQSNGQVIAEMPDHIVIETRPMPDGTIEVLYLRQIIERQVIDHAYREILDETGNKFPIPVKLAPTGGKSY